MKLIFHILHSCFTPLCWPRETRKSDHNSIFKCFTLTKPQQFSKIRSDHFLLHRKPDYVIMEEELKKKKALLSKDRHPSWSEFIRS